MAKQVFKNVAANEKKGYAGTIAALVLAALFAVAAVCFFGYASKDANNVWFRNGNIPSWLNYWGSGSPVTEPGADSENFVVDFEGNTNSKLRLYSARTAANNTKLTIRADFIPANTTETKVDWSLSMEGGNASEYFEITPAEDKAPEVTLKCLKPFLTPITLTCTSVTSPDVSATCTLHYIKAALYLWNDDDDKIVSSTTEKFCFDNYQYEEGTILPDEISGSVMFTLAPELVAHLESKGYGISEDLTIEVSQGDEFTIRDLVQLYIKDWNDEFEDYEGFWNAFGEYVRTMFAANGEVIVFWTIASSQSYFYNGTNYGDMYDEAELLLNSADEFTVHPEDVTLPDKVIFG